VEDETTNNIEKYSMSYPTERGSLAFEDNITISSEKDLAYRTALLNGRRELTRLKNIADLIAMQALETRKQIELAEAVSKAECNFAPRVGQEYWLAELPEKGKTILCHLGPDDWSAGVPCGYRYVGKVRQLPTGLWESADS
jgi:hypothetical protein